MTELINKGKMLGLCEAQTDGTMTFDYFMNTMIIIVEYTIKHT